MYINFIQILFLFQLILVGLKEIKINTNSSKVNNKEKINKILELNDSNFDLVIQNGRNNRWLIVFYLEACVYCYKAKTVLNRILELKEYKNINNIKFASIELSNNTKTNIRFNISQVPHIILVENNTMIEFNIYPSYKNFINFIETNFTNIAKGLKTFPKRNIFKYYYKKFESSISGVLNDVNNHLKSKNINFKFNPITFILFYILLCVAFWMIIFYGFIKCSGKKNHKIIKNFQNNDREEQLIKNGDNNDNSGKNENEDIKKEEINKKEVNKERNIRNLKRHKRKKNNK